MAEAAYYVYLCRIDADMFPAYVVLDAIKAGISFVIALSLAFNIRVIRRWFLFPALGCFAYGILAAYIYLKIFIGGGYAWNWAAVLHGDIGFLEGDALSDAGFLLIGSLALLNRPKFK